MVENKSVGDRAVVLAIYLFLALSALLCLLPLVNLLAVSLSDRAAASGNRVTFWPINFTLANYAEVVNSDAFLRSMSVSVQRTLLGTTLNVLMIILTAYPLSRDAREFKGRNIFMALMLVAMLFHGGLIPWFLNIRNLGLLDTMWALVLPPILQIGSVILAMNFFRSLPTELEEAAVMDGASHWVLLFRIVLPLSLPMLATVTLFAAVYHWNDWFEGMILIRTSTKVPLQTFIRRIVVENNVTLMFQGTSANLDANFFKVSNRAIKGAQVFIATLPILLIYPFLQHYFIHGIRLGAVKG
jgi:ABC-type glycerol-3-phosphate transport system permease component